MVHNQSFNNLQGGSGIHPLCAKLPTSPHSPSIWHRLGARENERQSIAHSLKRSPWISSKGNTTLKPCVQGWYYPSAKSEDVPQKSKSLPSSLVCCYHQNVNSSLKRGAILHTSMWYPKLMCNLHLMIISLLERRVLGLFHWVTSYKFTSSQEKLSLLLKAIWDRGCELGFSSSPYDYGQP